MGKVSRFLYLLFLISFPGIQVTAQGLYIGAKGGMSLSWLPSHKGFNNPVNADFDMWPGANFGVLAEYKFNRWLSVQPELLYSQQGGKRDKVQAFPNDMPGIYPERVLYADFKTEVHINTYSIPVQLKFSISAAKNFQVFLSGGMFLSYINSATLRSSGSSQLYQDEKAKYKISRTPWSFDTTINLKNQVSTYNHGFIMSAGVSYQVYRSKLFLEFGGNFGLIYLQQDPAKYGVNYPASISVQLGYAYNLRSARLKLIQ
jgi:hypothetical protein